LIEVLKDRRVHCTACYEQGNHKQKGFFVRHPTLQFLYIFQECSEISNNFSRQIEVGQNNANKSDNFSREINVRTTVKDCKEWLDIHLSVTGQPTGLLAIRL